MIHAAKEHHADAIGMSGLLVKSTLVMKENLEVLNEQHIKVPVILGGAALTRRYVEQDLKFVYKGQVFYANDAFDGLRFMEEIKNGKYSEDHITNSSETESEDFLIGSEAKIAMMLAENHKISRRSKINRDVIIPKPPFWGSKVVTDISLEEIFPFINEAALIRGQWKITRGKKSEKEYKQILHEQIYPEYEELKQRVIREKMLSPKVVYGYFPCQSDANELIIYNIDQNNPKLTELLRFSFPRQNNDRFLCISDYFAPIASGRVDVVAFHMVTMGNVASGHSKKLFESNEYKEYLYFHGLSVESAEALAELWHKRIRQELGIAVNDAQEIKRLFSQGYQGARFSFGYPACPNLEDHKKLFALLQPERIGVTMTDEYMLNPEQSTDAIIVHHPEARYFNVS
jgi:5-methyltetrahydrofolate--homocysteine methyltransferase